MHVPGMQSLARYQAAINAPLIIQALARAVLYVLGQPFGTPFEFSAGAGSSSSAKYLSMKSMVVEGGVAGLMQMSIREEGNERGVKIACMIAPDILRTAADIKTKLNGNAFVRVLKFFINLRYPLPATSASWQQLAHNLTIIFNASRAADVGTVGAHLKLMVHSESIYRTYLDVTENQKIVEVLGFHGNTWLCKDTGFPTGLFLRAMKPGMALPPPELSLEVRRPCRMHGHGNTASRKQWWYWHGVVDTRNCPYMVP